LGAGRRVPENKDNPGGNSSGCDPVPFHAVP
jgi:hypothetical protein